MMKGTFGFARVAGIDLKLHFTFPLILLLGAFQWGSKHGATGFVFGAVLMAALFVCVLLHELGHSLVAQRFGIPVREIVLMPIGGVAVFTRNIQKPLHELLIAVAGPAVNVGLAVILAGLILATGNPLVGSQSELVGSTLTAPSLPVFLHWLLIANVSLVLFNLVPAFPMDGGRILRALLAMGIGFRRATRWAAGIGQVIAVFAGVAALFAGNFLLALIALFVFFGAGREWAGEEARRILSTLRLGDAYNKHALTLFPGDRASNVVDYLLTSYQPDFAVMQGTQLLGVVTRERLLATLVAAPGTDPWVAGIMDREVERLPASLSLFEAQELLIERGKAVAAVVDGERYLGLINLEDIREALQISAVLHPNAEARAEEPAGAG
jgi:Zn-dependent protease/CBS domain-containing protein